MTAALIILAHTPGDARQAGAVSDELRALGFAVERLAVNAAGQRTLTRKLAQAGRLLVLWSRAAAASAALRAAAKQARAAGKLACVRLDASLPPAALGEAAPLPRGRAKPQLWAALLQPAPVKSAAKPAVTARRAAPAQTAKPSSPRPLGLMAAVGLVFAAIAAFAAAYASDASFAARINGWARGADEVLRAIGG